MALLSSRLELHDVRDVESFCGQVIRRSGLDLSWHEHDDLHTYLIETCWELSTRYRAGEGIKFSTWAGRTLGLRTVDWIRAHRGRTRWAKAGGTYERERRQLVSLDDPEHDRLVDALGEVGVDDSASRLADQLRSLGTRARPPARPQRWLGDEAA